ncbi:MAG: hypothetical protein N3A02_02530 [Rectinema sp.]|nr:hypothetical protein [Rectinema sp.]
MPWLVIACGLLCSWCLAGAGEEAERLLDMTRLVQRLREHYEALEREMADPQSSQRVAELQRSVHQITKLVEAARNRHRPSSSSEATSADAIAPHRTPFDAEKDMFGVRGTLYLMWSFKDPNAREIPLVLQRLHEDLPHVPVEILHVASWMDWEELFLRAKELEDEITRDLLSPMEIEKKNILLREYLEPIGLMAHYENSSGIPVFTDVTMAIILRIDATPAWTYVSRRGLAHRLLGVGPNLRLSEWIKRIDAWENKRIEEYRKQGIPEDRFLEALAKDMRTLARDR